MLPSSALLQGEIATAPDAGRIDVVITSFDTKQRFTGCRFMPRGATDPTVGDTCLVAFDDQGDAWVVAWDTT